MIISISIDDITAQLYAQTALRHHLDGNRPPLLTPDRRPALLLMARSAFAVLCMSMLPFATDCNIDNDGSDMLTLELPDGVEPVATRLLMEHIISSHILAEAYAGIDTGLSHTFAEAAETDTASLRRLLHAPSRLPSIHPYR